MATDDLKEYITGFCEAIESKDLNQISNYYENWAKFTDKYFKQSEWPNANDISSLVKDDKTFLFLYRELWYRHYYSKLGKEVTTEIRIGSWTNYCSFFDHLLNVKRPISLHLPVQWLWDIIDEFIYQYQEHKSRQKCGEESTSESAWDTVSVFKYLYKLVEKSGVKKVDEEKKATDFSKTQLYSYLGYWSIIGMCRLNVILGDYFLALKTLDPIQIHRRARYTQVPAAYISLYYYMGFAYMMLRRYSDAIKTFVSVLLYISRLKHLQSRPYDAKKVEQIYGLLAILLATSPKRIDEHVANTLRQDHSEHVTAVANKETEHLFSYACPKFVLASPVPPSTGQVDGGEGTVQLSALDLQRRHFAKSIESQALLPVILSYLKLYSTIDLHKLVKLLDDKVDVETLMTLLLCLSQKSHQLRWSGNTPLEGVWEPTGTIQFWVEDNMVHIVDSREKKKYARAFLRRSNKLEEMWNELPTTTV